MLKKKDIHVKWWYHHPLAEDNINGLPPDDDIDTLLLVQEPEVVRGRGRPSGSIDQVVK